MAGLSASESAQFHAANANLQRAMQDVQSLYATHQRMEHDLQVLSSQHLALKERTRRNEQVLNDILDDKKSLFRWVLAVTGTFVLTASMIAMKLKVMG